MSYYKKTLVRLVGCFFRSYDHIVELQQLSLVYYTHHNYCYAGFSQLEVMGIVVTHTPNYTSINGHNKDVEDVNLYIQGYNCPDGRKIKT